MKLPVVTESPKRRLPPWLKRPLPSRDFTITQAIVAESGVATVCEEARCPNLTECWSKRHATFMILGDRCTRRCHFCAVDTSRPDPPQIDEPRRVGHAVAQLNLKHVVLTAVARDDLADEGAGHFAQCVNEVHEQCPETTVEVLPADMHARFDCIETICNSLPDLFNHNIETVRRITPRIRPQARYDRSLEVLRIVRSIAPEMITKSGIMVGLGESSDELRRTMDDLRDVDCDVLTVGQYLQPSRDKHLPVERFYHPDEFDELADYGRQAGFLSVAAGPFVRSSYNAGEVFEESKRRQSQ